MLLPIDDVDLVSLVLARNDAHPDGDWWFDPETGRCLYLGVDDDDDVDALRRAGHALVPRQPQPPGDVTGFFDSPEAAGLDDDVLARLAGARRGKGGARRFRDVVQRTEAADAWSAYALRQESIRAIEWLLERDLVEPTSARRRRDQLASDGTG